MQLQNSSYKLSDVSVEQEQQPSGMSAQEAIQSWLVTKLAKLLSINAATIDAKEPLTRYGLDSIDAVTLVGDLEDWLGVELPSTLLWDYPTLEKSAQYLATEFDVSAALETAQPEVAKDEPKENTETAGKSKGWGGLWGRISGS